MTGELSAPPVLSTPDIHILSEIEPVKVIEPSQRLSDEQIAIRYEIDRTVREIRQNRWRKIALQFPDQMLPDSARVYQILARGLKASTTNGLDTDLNSAAEPVEDRLQDPKVEEHEKPVRLTILGDTSYGSCCVDEIAAEHVDADAIIHYGRSCLSPTARLPVVHVFTRRDLNHDAVCKAFKETFSGKNTNVIVTADTPYAQHVDEITQRLRKNGYTEIFAASIVHDPSSLIPNRTLPESVQQDPTTLNDWELFHISDPPTSFLLTLSSRMRSIHIYPTTESTSAPHQANTSLILRRRYALVTSLTTVSTWGILINTLSVKNYLHVVTHIRERIANAGKKSYLFVVGKLNVAKIANFDEIGGWVVVGCWESSLVDSRDFYRSIITPFELDMVLQGDEERLWTGEWRGDFQTVLDRARVEKREDDDEERQLKMPGGFSDEIVQDEDEERDFDSEEESAPPEFDLRTGRYVSHTRPMGQQRAVRDTEHKPESTASVALTKRSKGELLAVNGVVSPAAEFLAQKRTWRGLGSDFEIKYEDDEQGGLVEEGRTGIARGYTVGESDKS